MTAGGPGPEVAIRLSPDEATTVVNALRGEALRQHPEMVAAIGPDYDPWPSDMAAVADKIELAMREAE